MIKAKAARKSGVMCANLRRKKLNDFAFLCDYLDNRHTSVLGVEDPGVLFPSKFSLLLENGTYGMGEYCGRPAELVLLATDWEEEDNGGKAIGCR